MHSLSLTDQSDSSIQSLHVFILSLFHSFKHSNVQYSLIFGQRRSDIYTQIWPTLMILLRSQQASIHVFLYSAFILHIIRGSQVGNTFIFSGILTILAMRAWHSFVVCGEVVTKWHTERYCLTLIILVGLALASHAQIGLFVHRIFNNLHTLFNIQTSDPFHLTKIGYIFYNSRILSS